MIRHMLLLATILSSVNAISQETWVGYKPTEKVQAPFKDVAMAITLQIKTVSILEADGNNYEVVNTDETKKVTSSKKLNSDLRAFQIETCRNQGLKRCPILVRESSGSGVVNNGRDFYTCRHVIHNWITLAAKENNLTVDQIVPAMKILDSQKNVLYNSAADKGLMTIAAINADPRLNFVEKKIFDVFNNKTDLAWNMSDFVALTAPLDLIEPKNIPVLIPKAGQEVYISGYPGKTSLFGGTKKGDAPGEKLVSSSGKLQRLGLSVEAFTSTALGTHGMSGGLVSDKDGNILGLVCGGTDTSDLKNGWSQSFLIDVAGHERLWSTLEY